MPTQTTTRAIESDSEPEMLYNFLADASHIPTWAPVFADTIEHDNSHTGDQGNTHYRVTKNGESFRMELLLHPSAHAVDYIREMPGGKRGGAYIRVMPRPLGGSTITMTVPLAPNTTEDAVGTVLEQELANLVRLASS